MHNKSNPKAGSFKVF